MATRSRGGSRGPSLVTGGIVGIAVFLIGIVTIIIAIELQISETLAVLTGLFTLFGGSALQGYLISHLYVHDLGLSSGEFVIELLPFTFIILLFLIAGGAISAAVGGGGAKGGAAIALGYGLMTALSVLFLAVSATIDASVIVTAVIVGVIYPVVFGGIGGAITS